MKKNITQTLAVALALSFVVAPVLAYGANIGVGANMNIGVRGDKQDKREERSGGVSLDAAASGSARARVEGDDHDKKDSKDRLPPGIERAPGIQKRIDDGKGLPPGIFKRFFNFFFNHNGTSTPPISPIINIKDVRTVRGTTTVSIIWSTNVKTSTVVRYGTTTSPNASSTTVLDNSLLLNHEVDISGLTTNTTYYFVIIATDVNGKVKESQVFHFTTGPVDTTAPSILFITTFDVKATSTRIIWFTNESSNGRVWVSTSSPVVTTGTPTQSVVGLSLYHDLSLTGLASSTHYFYTVSSTDSGGNAATSIGEFTTSAN